MQILAKIRANIWNYHEIDLKTKVVIRGRQWPKITFDDFDTWRAMYGVFIGAYFESDIRFALNNYPRAQGSWK